MEDLLHIFTRCPRVDMVWQQLVASLVATTGLVPDEDLLLLAWLPAARDEDIATTIMVFVHLVWTTRGEARPPTFERLTVALRAKAAPFTPCGEVEPLASGPGPAPLAPSTQSA